MAFNAGAVRATLELGTTGFVNSLKRAGRALTGFRSEADKADSESKSLARRIVAIGVAAAGIAGGILVARAALRSLLGVLVTSSRAAAEYQQAVQELGVSLALQGSRDAVAATKGLQDYASALQNTTQFSDGAIVSVSQTLAVLGVQEKQLKEATKAVLDYSAATGRDATQSAINFGKTLGGVVGELGEAFPAVKELTQAQLQAGGAFELAAQQLGGFSEAVANTSQGIRAQLTNALGDLAKEIGFALNPVIDALSLAGIEAVRSFTESVRGNRNQIIDAFAGVADGLLQGASRALDFALDFPALLARGRAFVTELTASLQLGFTNIGITIQQAVLDLRTTVAELAQAFSFLLSDDKVQSLNAGLAETGAKLAIAKSEAAQAEEALLASARAAREQADAAEASAEAIRSGADSSSLLALGYNAASSAIEKGREALLGIDRTQDRVNAKVIAEIGARNTSAAATRRQLDHLREITGINPELEASTQSIAESVKAAADGTRDLAQAAADADAAFAGAASSASSLRGGGGGGPSSARQAGSSRLVGDTAAETAATLAGLQQRLTFTSSAFGLRASGRALVDQLAAALQGQVAQETAAFTQDIIRALDSQGIFDPVQREQIINQRLDEARRLGVLSRGGSTLGFTGGVG